MRSRVDPFLLLLLGSAAVGILVPAGGAFLDAVTLAAKVGVALLFFLHGLRLPPEDVLVGLSVWRIHLLILALTFGLFPFLGWLLQLTGDRLISTAAVTGFVFLCLVPSTVQSSVALTSIARGDRAVAVVAASISGLVGVAATPALVSLMLGQVAHPTAGAILRIVGLLFVPFALGQLARSLIHRNTTAKNSQPFVRFDKLMILFIVYVGFCNGTNAGVWSQISWQDLVVLTALCALLFAVVTGASFIAGRKHGRERTIAIFFAGTTKSLTAGLPMALILFPHNQFGLVILPLMIYHLLQLLVGATLAEHWGRTDSFPI